MKLVQDNPVLKAAPSFAQRVALVTLTQIDTLQDWHTHRNLQAFSLRSDALAGVSLDILLFPSVEPQAMCQRALRLDVSGVPVMLASIDYLIALKQSVAKPIDLADIEHLKRFKAA